MVNKAAVGILGVIVVASLGVGTLVGMQIAGTEPAESPSDSESTNDGQADDPAETETNGASVENTDGEEAGSGETGTEQQTSIPARQFDERQIAEHVAAFVNEERTERGRDEMSTTSNTARSVGTMAENYSVQMADAGETGHAINGVSTRQRYENHGLLERCKFEEADKDGIRHPDERFEAVGFTYAGQHYEHDGNTSFNEDERAVARTIVDQWMADDDYRERLLRPEPTNLGVGVELTRDGETYVTANLCA